MRVKAEWKLGDKLAEFPKAKGTAGMGRPKIGGTKSEPPKDDQPTLAEIGIDRKRSALAQKLSEMPKQRVSRVASLAMMRKPSVDFCGYLQRHKAA